MYVEIHWNCQFSSLFCFLFFCHLIHVWKGCFSCSFCLRFIFNFRNGVWISFSSVVPSIVESLWCGFCVFHVHTHIHSYLTIQSSHLHKIGWLFCVCWFLYDLVMKTSVALSLHYESQIIYSFKGLNPSISISCSKEKPTPFMTAVPTWDTHSNVLVAARVEIQTWKSTPR